jgi:hypothetical protein
MKYWISNLNKGKYGQERKVKGSGDEDEALKPIDEILPVRLCGLDWTLFHGGGKLGISESRALNINYYIAASFLPLQSTTGTLRTPQN